MNHQVLSLLVVLITSNYTEGGILKKDYLSNSNPKDVGVESATPDNIAAASNQGWSPANTYLPAHPGVQGYQGPMILPDGTIAETADVAAARAAHLAALEAARASDPDMGRDDGEYDPQKYGDHLYGIVAHSEDLLQSILSYQTLAQGGGVSKPVYGAPGAGIQTLTKAMNDASATGAMYGAPGRVSPPAPVYGPPAAGSAGNAAAGAQATAHGGGQMYTGPLAMLQLLASGYLADTPEVVAARNTHLKALLEAQAAADLWRTKQASGQAHPWG